jgi:hypothetical protein
MDSQRDFCLFSVHYIQLAAPLLSNCEQTGLTDQPYTKRYFVKLINRIKQSTQQVQGDEGKGEKGGNVNEMVDPEP